MGSAYNGEGRWVGRCREEAEEGMGDETGVVKKVVGGSNDKGK